MNSSLNLNFLLIISVQMMKILVVEDNPKNLKLCRVIIEYLGHRCLAAEDGVSGVAMARAEAPDLVLMDIQMPRLDGVAALRQLRQHEETRSMPVVALTSYAMKGDREKFLAEGFDDYLIKPMSKGILIEIIRRWTAAQGK